MRTFLFSSKLFGILYHVSYKPINLPDSWEIEDFSLLANFHKCVILSNMNLYLATVRIKPSNSVSFLPPSVVFRQLCHDFSELSANHKVCRDILFHCLSIKKDFNFFMSFKRSNSCGICKVELYSNLVSTRTPNKKKPSVIWKIRGHACAARIASGHVSTLPS